MKRKAPIKRKLNKAYFELNAPGVYLRSFFFIIVEILSWEGCNDLLLLDGQM